ncbi:MAG: hypothetical protein AB7M05_11285 [Alphaproteobacteria bacterium]
MRRNATCFLAALGGLALLLSACSGVRVSPNALRSDLPPAQLTAVEARDFRTADKLAVIHAVAKILLETGFVLDRVDPQGKVWASAEIYFLSFKVVATVTPRGVGTMQVRFVADKSQGSDIMEVDDPKFYDDKFFTPLAENLRLPALPAT